MFEYLIKPSQAPALHYGAESYNYDELLRYAHLYSDFFAQRGAVERVMFYSPNTPQYIFALYGAFRAGAITIPVDVMSTERELSYMINDSRPQYIYTIEDKRSFVEECVAMVGDAEYCPIVFTHDGLDRSGVEALSGDQIDARGTDDVMTIIYTSGTTGSPKGVMLTFENLWYNVDAVTNQVKIFNSNTRLCALLPMHHIFAFAGALVAPLYAGGQIFMVENLAPETIIATMKRSRATAILGVPRLYEGFAKGIMGKINANPVARMLYGLCSVIGSQSLSRKIFKAVHETFGGEMEYFVSGGAALSIEVATIFKNLGLYVLEGYGMTECAPMISFTRPGERKVGFCGRLLPGCEHKIDPETGELAVRGANVMKGYYGRPEETAAVIREGWLHTGDTATYDDQYGIKITGRIKEIIVTPNGKNINPVEIENLITERSKVIKEVAVFLADDILQALVYPDVAAAKSEIHSTLDELVRAEIEAYNRTAMGYKRVMRYHTTSQELPKTRLGKIQRYKLSDFIKGGDDEEQREDVSDRSECFKLLKSFVDDQTSKYANGDSHFEIDLALDSLGRVSLISFIEDTFGVSVSETELSDLSTINLLSEYVEERSQSTTLTEGDQSWDEILSGGDVAEMKLPKSGLIHWFMDTKLWLLFSIFYRFTSRGERENMPEGAALIVANHCSGFDGVFVTSKMRWRDVHNTYFFAKSKHFDGGFKHFMAEHNNIILMNINSNVRESMKQMYEVLRRGKKIIIFPEGTRSKSGDMGEFKESFAILSKALNVPVIPVAIRGSVRATYNAVRVPRIGCNIDLSFMPQMLPQAEENPKQFAQRVEGVVRAAVEE